MPVAVPVESTEPIFARLRDFVLDDLHKIIRCGCAPGGNYAATALIVCACDSLGRLVYGADYEGVSSSRSSCCRTNGERSAARCTTRCGMA